MKHYERDYRKSLEDSPAETRRDVNRAIMHAIRDGQINPQRILDVGSGPQLLERTLLQTYGSGEDPQLLKKMFFATVDIAQVRPHRLKAQKHVNVSHGRADAEHLPFAPRSFGLVVSNMAIDMMPRATFSEVAAALAENGMFIFTFHHPEMMQHIVAHTRDNRVREFVTYALENNMYFQTSGEIRTTLMEHGLIVQHVDERSDLSKYSNDKWWLVRGIKGEKGDLASGMLDAP